MLKRRLVLMASLLALFSAAWAQTPSRLIIDSGHKDSIASLAYHSQTGYLLTADNSGVVKVWDLAAEKLVHEVNTGFRGSMTLRAHPEKRQFALLVSRPGHNKIAVWDWEKRQELFNRDLSDRPIQFEYSGRGKFLFTTKINTPSIIMIDSQTGREYSYLKRLYDLFSYGYIGSSETRVMTYSNSGTIKYWDLRTSTLQNETATLADLSRITVLQTEGRRYFMAQKGKTLYLIDRLNGSVRDSLTIEEMVNFSLDPISGTIAVVSQSPTGRLKVSAVGTGGARFSPLDLREFLSGSSPADPLDVKDSTDFFSISGSLTGSLISQGRVFLSDSNGIIWTIHQETLRAEVFKKNLLADIKDLNFIGDTLYILSSKNLIQLESANFSKSSGRVSLTGFSDISISQTASPLPGNSEIEPVNTEKMIIWTRDSVRKGYVLYNPQTRTVLNSNYNFNSALNQLHVRNDQILVLENSGEASLNNIHTGFRDFQFSALGMVSLNFLNDQTLLGGKSLMKTGRNPMFTVQTDTGEIIPLQDNRFLVYEILSPPGSNKTFTIGLAQRSSGGVETTIRSHGTSETSNSSTQIYSRQGEWIDAIFTADSSTYTPTLYGTVSGRDIIRISGTRKRTWEYDSNIEKIFYHNSLLYILNTNGSLTLFDPRSGREILDYYLMEDGNWIVLPGQSSSKPFLSSSTASLYLNTFHATTGRALRNSYAVME